MKHISLALVYQRFLANLFEYYTLVFIGYSLSDIELINIIRNTQLELDRRAKTELRVGLGKRVQLKHYIIMPKDSKVNSDAINELQLRAVIYNGDQDDYHILTKLLSYIRSRTTDIHYPEPKVYREMFEDGYNV